MEILFCCRKIKLNYIMSVLAVKPRKASEIGDSAIEARRKGIRPQSAIFSENSLHMMSSSVAVDGSELRSSPMSMSGKAQRKLDKVIFCNKNYNASS